MKANLKASAVGLILSAATWMCGTAVAYDMTWNTVDGGGGMNSTGGQFSMSGTIGQPDAGTMAGGQYTLFGGFWVPDLNQSGPCFGDLNHDHKVDLSDLAILLGHYGETGAPPDDGDLNGDGNVDLSDLASILSVYGNICP